MPVGVLVVPLVVASGGLLDVVVGCWPDGVSVWLSVAWLGVEPAEVVPVGDGLLALVDCWVLVDLTVGVGDGEI